MNLELNYWLAKHVMRFPEPYLKDLKKYSTFYFPVKDKPAVCWNPSEHWNDAMRVQETLLRQIDSILLSHQWTNGEHIFTCNGFGAYSSALTLPLAICLFATAVWPKVPKTSQAPAPARHEPRRKGKRRRH